MNVYLMIAVCSAVTLVPRILPLFVRTLDSLPKTIRKCMLLLPIAALGCLIFPLSLTDFSSSWYAGLVGVVAAFLSSYFRRPMIISIIISLVLTTLMLVLFP